MRAIIAEDQPFTRREYSIDEGLALFEDQPFKVEIINAVETAPTDEDLGEVGSGPVVSTYSNSADFHRPVSRPARALDGAARSLQVDARRRRVLARR